MDEEPRKPAPHLFPLDLFAARHTATGAIAGLTALRPHVWYYRTDAEAWLRKEMPERMRPEWEIVRVTLSPNMDGL